MKSLLYISLFSMFIFACNKERDLNQDVQNSEGIPFISGGLFDCPYQIFLEDQSILHPVNDTVLIGYKSGQHISFDYEIDSDSRTCEGITDVLVSNIEDMQEELGCKTFDMVEEIDFEYLKKILYP